MNRVYEIFDHLPIPIGVFSQSLGGGINVIQLETAAGAAIRNFSKAVGQCLSKSK